MKQVVFLLLINSVAFAETILLGVKDDFSVSNGAEVLSINDSLVQSGYSDLQIQLLLTHRSPQVLI